MVIAINILYYNINGMKGQTKSKKKSCNHPLKANKYETPVKNTNAHPERKTPVKILPTFLLDIGNHENTENKKTKKSTPRKASEKRPLSSKRSENNIKKTNCRSVSQTPAQNKNINYCNVPNFNSELEKLIRAVFRHSVVCQEFKSDLLKIEANGLLNYYADMRTKACSN